MHTAVSASISDMILHKQNKTLWLTRAREAAMAYVHMKVQI